MNGLRPVVLITPLEEGSGDDVTVIPLTSVNMVKHLDPLDVFVARGKDEKLYQPSVARVRQIRTISSKRIREELGEIADPEVRKKISVAVNRMFGN